MLQANIRISEDDHVPMYSILCGNGVRYDRVHGMRIYKNEEISLNN